jgi:dynein heavy chain, axonemal
VSKIFQGISRASPKAIKTENDMIKLWAHECLRVFSDRLISDADHEKFENMLKEQIKEKFKKDWSAIVEVEPLMFASFVPMVYPDGDTTKRPFNDLYCELTDRDKLKDQAETSLLEYNQFNVSKKMNLVLFNAAIEHIVKIHRVISTEFGHALLVGVGGSGRKSLTQLATFIAQFDSFEIEISKNYDFKAWREDMKEKLYMSAGIDSKQTVFIFSDTQITQEMFMEDLNNILNGGLIPNLYTEAEEIGNILDQMKDANKNNAAYKNFTETEVMQDFLNKAKANIHLVLTMSPIGEDFKRRLRMFPSLVNCCTIDWFLPWPKEALQSVAEFFLNPSKIDLDNREGIIKICVDMQERVSQLTQRYYQELKRFYYVTPTSYLVLIKTFQGLLGTKRN